MSRYAPDVRLGSVALPARKGRAGLAATGWSDHCRCEREKAGESRWQWVMSGLLWPDRGD